MEQYGLEIYHLLEFYHVGYLKIVAVHMAIKINADTDKKIFLLLIMGHCLYIFGFDIV